MGVETISWFGLRVTEGKGTGATVGDLVGKGFEGMVGSRFLVKAGKPVAVGGGVKDCCPVKA